jgi:hypothetical protein
MDRVHNVPKFRFFNEREQAILDALCERVVPQDHRAAGRRVPIAPWIDQRLQNKLGDGFRFEDMPSDEVAWRTGLAGIDQAASELFGQRFTELPASSQDAVLERVRRGDPPGKSWKDMNVRRFWVNVVLRQVVGVFYAHPFSWDEIGFGGPAYPRGYFALNNGAREPWEAKEVDGAGRAERR